MFRHVPLNPKKKKEWEQELFIETYNPPKRLIGYQLYPYLFVIAISLLFYCLGENPTIFFLAGIGFVAAYTYYAKEYLNEGWQRNLNYYLAAEYWNERADVLADFFDAAKEVGLFNNTLKNKDVHIRVDKVRGSETDMYLYISQGGKTKDKVIELLEKIVPALGAEEIKVDEFKSSVNDYYFTVYYSSPIENLEAGYEYR